MLRAINLYRNCKNFESINCVRNFWKSFSILDCIGYVDSSWQEVTELTLNKSWSKLLPEIVSNPRKPTEDSAPYEKTVQGVVNMAQEISGKGFQDATESEILESVLPGTETLTIEEVVKIVVQKITESQLDCEKEESNLDIEFHFQLLIKIIINCIQSGIDTVQERLLKHRGYR